MAKSVSTGLHTITPVLLVKDCAKAMEFYGKAFGAEEKARYASPDGSIVFHGEMQIGDAVFYLAEAMPDWGGATQSVLMLNVGDCDAVFERAIAAGATVVRPLQNQFYGDRSGQLADPFGQKWGVSTHVEDVSEEEIARRMKAMQYTE